MKNVHERIHDAKFEFELDGARAVYSTFHVEVALREDDDDELVLDAQMTDIRAAELLAAFPEGEFLHRIKFVRAADDDEVEDGGEVQQEWIVEDKYDPVRTEKKKGQLAVEISRGTKPGTLTGIDQVYYRNAYPVTAVVYGLYPLRDPDPANLAPIRDGDLNCVAQSVVDHFEGALRGQGLTFARRQKIGGGKSPR